MLIEFTKGINGEMIMKMGDKIKELRIEKGYTQEQLANDLSISFQAVSKWENGITYPDVQMIPKISAYFGITIDELFAISDETHFERIEVMIDEKTNISREEFDYAINYLDKNISNGSEVEKCSLLKAQLLCKIGEDLFSQARILSQKCIEDNPRNKDAHSVYWQACCDRTGDWNISNRGERIGFYKEFTRKNPDFFEGLIWLFDDLIADHQLDEAWNIIQKMKKLSANHAYDSRIKIYEARYLAAKGDLKKFEEKINEVIESEPANWIILAMVADTYAMNGLYEQAIKYNVDATSAMQSPKFTDMLESAAQMYILLEQKSKAVEMYKMILDILREDWNITEGVQVEKIHNQIIMLI